MSWKKESTRHSLARKGIQTIHPVGYKDQSMAFKQSVENIIYPKLQNITISNWNKLGGKKFNLPGDWVAELQYAKVSPMYSDEPEFCMTENVITGELNESSRFKKVLEGEVAVWYFDIYNTKRDDDPYYMEISALMNQYDDGGKTFVEYDSFDTVLGEGSCLIE